MARQVCYLLKAKPSQAQLEAGNYPKEKRQFRGLTVSIENPAGSVRSGVDRDGHKWRIKMHHDYGYINRSMGVDGDQVDCYIGPDESADTVYVVHQRKAGDWKAYDEDKCMLGFASQEDAIAAYLKHYDDRRFLGPVTAMPFDEFNKKVLATMEKPSMIKSCVLFFKSLVPTHVRRLKSGKVVQVRAFENNRAARSQLSADERAAQGSLFDELDQLAAQVKPKQDVGALLTPKPAATDTRGRRKAALGILGDGWESAPDGKKDGYKKKVKYDGGHFSVLIRPAKTVDGNFYVGSYFHGGKHSGPGNAVDTPKTLEEARDVAESWLSSVAAQAAADQRHADLSAKFKEFGDGFELRHENGRQWAVLMPDATNEGKYRYQVFGESGLKAHYTYNNREEALRGAVQAGFVEPDAGAMDRLAPKWAEKFADPEVQAAATKHGDRTADDHPAPVPKMALSGLSDDDRAKWIDLHRQQHETMYRDLFKVRKDLDAARSKRNKAETAYNEWSATHKQHAESGLPGSKERAESAAAEANKHGEEYRKHRNKIEQLSARHAELHGRVVGLGKEKDKLVPGSGDLQLDLASYSRRTDAEEAEHAKRQNAKYKAGGAPRVVSVKPSMGRNQVVGNSLREISGQYHAGIPIGKILDSVRSQGFEPVQEDGTPWEGMLTGAEGRASIDLKGSKKALHVQWYKMPSGKYEVNAYLN